MKRVILSAILLTLLLSGCGGTKTTAEKPLPRKASRPRRSRPLPPARTATPRRRSWDGRTGPCWR